MKGLSDPTLGVLIVAASNLSMSNLKTLLMRAGLYGWRDPDEYDASKHGLLRSQLLIACSRAEDGHRDAQRGLLTFARLVVEQTVRDPEHAPCWFEELRDDLLADGYKLRWEQETGRWGLPGPVSYMILPTDAASVPLAREISALEGELSACGYTSVLNHYRQAVDGLANHKYESANGDLRTALEDLVTRLAEDNAGYQRVLGPVAGRPRASQGGAAISHLIQQCHLPASDGGKLLQGLWDITHTNGSRPGQSDADETRFRMQVITATARFLLKHFSARPRETTRS
jgi:hypothetical protein